MQRSRRWYEVGEEIARTVPLKISDEESKNCRGQVGKRRYRMPLKKTTNEEIWIEKVKDTTVDEEAVQPTTCQWKKPSALWQTGKVRWWQTGAQEEGTGER